MLIACRQVINRLCDGALAPAAQAEAILGLVLPTLLSRGISSHEHMLVNSLCT